jgi:ESS family glutamate:Na+ symporter
LIFLGVLLCICFFKYLAPVFFKEHYFEKALFTWGWSLGGLVFGLALLKIVTNEKTNLKLLEQISTSYLLMSPIEITLLLTLPYLLIHGYGAILAIILFLLAFMLIKSELKVTDK